MDVAVVGAGSWGTTIASLLAARTPTTIWAREPDVAQAIDERHENPVFLPGLPLSPRLRASTSLADVLEGADVVVLAVPSRFYRSVLDVAAPLIAPSVPVVSLTKGLEEGTLLRMSQVARDVLDGHETAAIGVLSGPNLAREIHAGQPAATVIAFPDIAMADELQHLFMSDRLRVYTNTDLVGCEIGGSLKNVIALAAGMSYGLGYGTNSQAALVTRGLAEVARLGTALGGDPLTFLGLAGLGDLVATCASEQSRNRTVGVELARGRSLADVVAGMRMVAEGVETAAPAVALAHREGVELPIAEQVVAVLEGSRSPVEAVDLLMQRAARHERHGLA